MLFGAYAVEARYGKNQFRSRAMSLGITYPLLEPPILKDMA